MLVIGLGIGMIVAGIIALVRGRLHVSNAKSVTGVWAYLLGLGLIAALPVGFLVAFVYMLFHVDPNKPDQVDQWGKENDLTLTLIVAGVEIGIALIVVIIGACLAKPYSPNGSRSRGEYDDFEDVPRRRRAVDDHDDDDFPRRQRPRDEYDYDDDRPRRRDDLDDRAR